MSEEWRDSFEAFLRDMGKRPSSKHTIERKDNNGPYSKDNCCWATYLEQNNNKRNTVLLCCGNESLTIAEWARRSGMKYTTLYRRLERGMGLVQALTTPVREWPSN